MKLENSPSIEDSGVQEGRPKKDNKRIRVLLSTVAIILVLLLGFTFVKRWLPAGFGGKGTVSGTAVNEAGQPIPVQVMIFGTDILVPSDTTGHFVVKNVPAGKQLIIVAYEEIAAEVEVSVKTNTENSVGTVTVPTNLLELID